MRRLIPLLLVALVAAAGCGDDEESAAPPATTATQAPRTTATAEQEPQLARADGEPEVQTLAEGLEVPWELAFLPDGGALITERGGTIRHLTAAGELRDEPVGRVEVLSVGEGGLLGLAVDPAFEDNGFVYAYRTTAGGNEVLRLTFDGDAVVQDAVILDGIRAGPIHDGGRLRIGPDERLYVTTGDAGQEELAQQGGLNGKVLRMAPSRYRADGGRADVLSTGHRNPQGLAFQPGSGRLFATEHGPDGDDEVNVLREGANYGWPIVRGAEHGDFRAPIAVYPQSIAPSGATFVTLPGSRWTGDLLIGALVGEQIRRLALDGTTVTENEPLFEGEHGRIRSVVEAPDGSLYALTNNTDGRGSPREGDDRVLRIVPPAG